MLKELKTLIKIIIKYILKILLIIILESVITFLTLKFFYVGRVKSWQGIKREKKPSPLIFSQFHRPFIGGKNKHKRKEDINQ